MEALDDLYGNRESTSPDAPLAVTTRKLLSGNEALALGAYQAGVVVAAAYPGTPSTEILESVARFDGVYAEWAPNEKVALEVGMGAAYAGARAMVSMKHVGLNVAADPFFAASVTGVRGGLVVISADDPSMHSSQNEQDNRHYARFAKVPLLEPADSQECYELVQLAFHISERFDTPVLLRTTTRISHSKSIVEVWGGRQQRPMPARFWRQPEKLVMIPAYARRRRAAVEARMASLAEYAEGFPHNRLLPGRSDLGILTSGVAYQYAREVFPDATFLKLSLSYPLPIGLVRKLAGSVSRMIVVEELDPFLEEMVRGLGIEVVGKRLFPIIGELSADAVVNGAMEGKLLTPLDDSVLPAIPTVPLPARPPVLCPGCPHTAFFYAAKRLGFYRGVADSDAPRENQLLGSLRRAGVVVAGDIGCYTLSVLPPLLAMDTTTCMGASIGHALGLEKAGLRQKVVAVIGDSTFLHSGITPLLDVVYNKGTTTTVILDNSTTAMTGHQDHPGTGVTAKGVKTIPVDLERLVRGLGVEDVHTVDAFDLSSIEGILALTLENNEPSVMIVRGACALQNRGALGAVVVDGDKCDGCAACIRTGCPALSLQEGLASIDPQLCIGAKCLVCIAACPQDAIQLHEEGGC